VNETFGFLAQVLRITVPYALAALGGVISERSGVIALGLEGQLLAGAFVATVGASIAGAHAVLATIIGVTGGVAGGMLTAGGYELAVVRRRADQIVTAVAMNLLVLGLTRYGLELIFGSASSSGKVAGPHGTLAASLFVGLTVLLTIAVFAVIDGTPFGLRLRASGEHAEAARSLGVDVSSIRWSACLACGALAGLGGAWLALDVHTFNDGMSAGRGYIALAAVIFGRWRPVPAVLACLLFGAADAAQVHLQSRHIGVPRELVQILPYVVTMIALPSIAGRARAPSDLGRPL
jgi:simple sugar transport system permease protein